MLLSPIVILVSVSEHIGIFTFCFLKGSRLLVEFEFSSDAHDTVIHFAVD